MTKLRLSDTYLNRLPDPGPGKRADIMDVHEPGFGVRIRHDLRDGKPKATFILFTRYPVNGVKSVHPTRRALGEYAGKHGMTLAEARERARFWKSLISKGIDPAAHEREERDAAAKRRMEVQQAEISARRGLFSSVAQEYLQRPEFLKQRRQAQVKREIEKELLGSTNPWKDRHVSEIDDTDIAGVIAAIRDRPAPYQAYNVLAHIRAIFQWARRPANRKNFGLSSSPLDGIQPKDFELKKEPRQRVLTDLEIAAFWRAAEKMGYPNGSVFRLLLITGQRKSEIAEASWNEVDTAQKILTVPSERFKSDSNHIVPLAPMALTLLGTVPRFKGPKTGDFIFTTTNGLKPINGFSKAKLELDRRMTRCLRAYARLRGDDPKKIKLEPFVLHDLRRTVRTRLSGLKVPEPVAEIVIGHGKRGLSRIYDQHKYLNEMREALDAWAIVLEAIVGPRSSKNSTTRHLER